MRVKGKGRYHGPNRDILCRIKNIHDKIQHCEENEIGQWTRQRKSAEVGKKKCQRNGRNDGARKHPRFELAPARLCLIDDISNKRIDKELAYTKHENDGRDDANHVNVPLLIIGLEQIARDENHKIGADHGIEHIMTKSSACITNALQQLAFHNIFTSPRLADSRFHIGDNAVCDTF